LATDSRNQSGGCSFCRHHQQKGRKFMGRGILLWLLGVPIPIIILLALFSR
jgi:hypothetical protein